MSPSLEKEIAIHSGVLTGKPHGQRSLVDCAPGVTGLGLHLGTKAPSLDESTDI